MNACRTGGLRQVFFVVEPKFEWDAGAVKRRERAVKRAKIAAAELFRASPLDDENSSESTEGRSGGQRFFFSSVFFGGGAAALFVCLGRRVDDCSLSAFAALCLCVKWVEPRLRGGFSWEEAVRPCSKQRQRKLGSGSAWQAFLGNAARDVIESHTDRNFVLRCLLNDCSSVLVLRLHLRLYVDSWFSPARVAVYHVTACLRPLSLGKVVAR